MLHEVQMYSQITPMEIDILFQLADCRHPDGSVAAVFFSEVECVCCTLRDGETWPVDTSAG